MTIYDFSLCSMYVQSGVDAAICYRSKLLEKNGYDVKLIFNSFPTKRDLELYLGLGARFNQILVSFCYFTDNQCVEPTIKSDDFLNKHKGVIGFDIVEKDDNSIKLYKNKALRAVVSLINGDYVYSVEYWNNGWKERMDYYSDCLYLSVFYEAVKLSNGYAANPNRRVFYNKDGSIAFSQIVSHDDKKISERTITIFSDGSRYKDEEMFDLFIEKLNLTKKDIVLLDRPISIFPTKSIFLRHDKTNIVAYVHSEHYFTKGNSVEGIRLNREYWYWAKHSKYIDYIVTSTKEQKDSFIDYLKRHNLFVPKFKDIPIFGIDELRYPTEPRKRKSVVCISRLFNIKKIEWTIQSVIKAHEFDDEITLDIYGTGRDSYIDELSKIIEDNNASSYIRLMGFADVKDLYKKYEVFITTSLTETFGITLLEACASGLALLAFNVKYGNRLFIDDGINGYLVNYDPAHFTEEIPSEIDELSSKIVDIVNDVDKLNTFSKNSYKKAVEFLTSNVERRLIEFINEIENESVNDNEL